MRMTTEFDMATGVRKTACFAVDHITFDSSDGKVLRFQSTQQQAEHKNPLPGHVPHPCLTYRLLPKARVEAMDCTSGRVDEVAREILDELASLNEQEAEDPISGGERTYPIAGDRADYPFQAGQCADLGKLSSSQAATLAEKVMTIMGQTSDSTDPVPLFSHVLVEKDKVVTYVPIGTGAPELRQALILTAASQISADCGLSGLSEKAHVC